MRYNIWRMFLISVLCLALAAPARATNFDTLGKELVTGIVVVSAGIAILVTVLVLHHKNRKSTITGCVTSGPNGMTLQDEKDKRTYALSGDPVGIKAGERMTIEGRGAKIANALTFQAHSVAKDFGACQP